MVQHRYCSPDKSRASLPRDTVALSSQVVGDPELCMRGTSVLGDDSFGSLTVTRVSRFMTDDRPRLDTAA